MTREHDHIKILMERILAQKVEFGDNNNYVLKL